MGDRLREGDLGTAKLEYSVVGVLYLIGQFLDAPDERRRSCLLTWVDHPARVLYENPLFLVYLGLLWLDVVVVVVGYDEHISLNSPLPHVSPDLVFCPFLDSVWWQPEPFWSQCDGWVDHYVDVFCLDVGGHASNAEALGSKRCYLQIGYPQVSLESISG